jgi:pimeloyl-ACP methyl ester carboxylesterase
MPRAHANGIEIEYDSFGDPGAPAVLLIMGLGAQMILWDEAFCAALVERGFHVVRFDNRDVGLSTKLDHAGKPSVLAAMEAMRAGKPLDAPYLLADMADDAVALLDALGIERVHVVGASMGGMIAQTIAIRHPARVQSLTSIMSTTGDPDLPNPTPEAMRALLTPSPGERAAYIEHAVAAVRVLGSPGFPFDEKAVRSRAARSYDRSFHPAGFARQMVAVWASGSRTAALASVRVPALVIHGDADPLIPVAAGRATAAAIQGAALMVIEGMGHDLPRPVWDRIADAIARCALGR